MAEEQLCSLCEVQRITWHGIEFCAICDGPPDEEAIWFVYWCYQEPE